MPKGTKVHKIYTALKKIGMSTAKAAEIAQSKTGQSLKTGKFIRKKRIGGPKIKRRRTLKKRDVK